MNFSSSREYFADCRRSRYLRGWSEMDLFASALLWKSRLIGVGMKWKCAILSQNFITTLRQTGARFAHKIVHDCTEKCAHGNPLKIKFT